MAHVGEEFALQTVGEERLGGQVVGPGGGSLQHFVDRRQLLVDSLSLRHRLRQQGNFGSTERVGGLQRH